MAWFAWHAASPISGLWCCNNFFRHGESVDKTRFFFVTKINPPTITYKETYFPIFQPLRTQRMSGGGLFPASRRTPWPRCSPSAKSGPRGWSGSAPWRPTHSRRGQRGAARGLFGQFPRLRALLVFFCLKVVITAVSSYEILFMFYTDRIEGRLPPNEQHWMNIFHDLWARSFSSKPPLTL